MKKKSSIAKICIIGVVTIIGLVMSFCSFNFGTHTLKSFASAIKLGLDLKGGIYAVYEMDETEDTSNLSSRMDGTRTRLENMLHNKEYPEATVVKEGTRRLRVEVPDVSDPGNLFDIIGKPATLTFRLDKDGTTVFTGQNVLKAEATYNNGEPVVSLSLDKDGTARFAEVTANNIGETISIIATVEGEEQVISSPKIENAIPNGQAIINGMGTYENAQNLADQITSGQFEVKLSLLECSTISPTLGQQALKYGIIAGIIGLILVMAFLSWRYRMLGGLASLALLMYTALMLFFLAVLPWVQLTLPGIAGIILSIGMAVDANVIIFERIKDEYGKGKSILAATHAGFKKATMAIIDSNVTTIIAAIVLLIFGTGTIQSFAITLLVGILLSLFTSMLITRWLVKSFITLVPDKPKLYALKREKGYEDQKEELENAKKVITPEEVVPLGGEVINETV